MRISLFLAATAALLSAAPAFAAPPTRSGTVIFDGDPYRAGPGAQPQQPAPAPAEDAVTQPTTRAYVRTDDDGRVVSNSPIPDTPENRARYGGPTSKAGQRTTPRGN